MKIIYVSHLHPPLDAPTDNIGGTQTVSSQVLQTLQQRSDVVVHPVVLSTPQPGMVLPTARFLVQLYRTLPQIVTAENADAVFFISMVTASISALRRRAIPVPMFALTHGHDVIWPFGPYQQLVRQVFQNLDGVISVSRATQTACLDRGLSPEKSIVVPNGLMLQPNRSYDPDKAKRLLAQALDLDLEGQRLLISVGRQIRRKGHQWFIDQVFPRVQTPAIYLCIGTGPEAKAIAQAKQRSTKSSHIVLPGRLPQSLLRLAYDAADLFLMPNIPVPGDMEGFGVVILEANEARTPVIATDLEGIRDVIREGVNGYLVDPLAPQKFANCIDTTLNQGYGHLSHACYQHLFKTYEWSHICDQYLNFFQQ
ncbi:glycosyltransferase family 4 protein [Lyngbya confervoides]|uniref:Glycosyltransferase family 4 protein n=1 Tax=Lyngbya confervoides BDU141951 TaxID=1574623 RepID=A0ABD4T840_9CYAN|nr:glycosyltransferase family 4 protein [Lyngbya confervoides]MCM1984619.1 glycosyltransferase family 4 protein [Lyngbya confervoides BDU141951]